MISAHLHHQPAAGASRAVARIARAGMLACALAWLGLAPAHAQHGRGQYRGDSQQMQQDPRADYYPPPREDGAREQRFDPRSFDSREFDDVRARRRQQQEQGQNQNQNQNNGEPMRRPRLTPDERRDLRRQINEAGSELYQHPPRH